MKLKIRTYVTGLAFSFLWNLFLIAIIGVITTFVIVPVFIFIKTGQFIFIPNMDFAIKMVKGSVACAFAVSFITYNLHAFRLYDDGSGK
jgi:hypothetical protein